MGFFSEIASEARRGMAAPTRQSVAPPAAPEPKADPPAAVPETPETRPEPAPPCSAEARTPPPQAEPAPSAHTPPPEVKLAVTEDATPSQDDTAARQAHEAAEAKRKAEFDAKQARKRAARQEQLDRIAAMDDAELLEAAVGRVAADTERLTRRNMKEAVAEHISAKCREDAAFARLVLRPETSMAGCIQFIYRKAREYAEQEMKDNGIERTGAYGLDIPDALIFQWAEDHFRNPDAKDDDEKFVPRPYVPSARKAAKPKDKAKAKPEKKKPAAEKPKAASVVPEQMSLL